MIPKEETEIRKWLEELEKNPLTVKVRADLEQANLTKRIEAARIIEELRKQQSETIPKLIENLEAKEETFKKAKAALDEATRQYSAAKYELSTDNFNLETAIGNQEAGLIQTADPALDEAITFFRGKLQWLMQPGRISHNRTGATRNIFTDKKTVKAESNQEAVKTALEYCRAAIKELERMKLSPALDIKRIEAMKKRIPPIDSYTEYTGEKPFPRQNTNPFAGFPSDSEWEYRKQKHDEEFKKIMKR